MVSRAAVGERALGDPHRGSGDAARRCTRTTRRSSSCPRRTRRSSPAPSRSHSSARIIGGGRRSRPVAAIEERHARRRSARDRTRRSDGERRDARRRARPAARRRRLARRARREADPRAYRRRRQRLSRTDLRLRLGLGRRELRLWCRRRRADVQRGLHADRRARRGEAGVAADVRGPRPCRPIRRSASTSVTIEHDDHDGGRPRVEARQDSTTGGYVLTGTIGVNDSVALELAYPDPGRVVPRRAARGARAARHRRRSSRRRATRAPAPGRAAVATTPDTLFSILSPPLRAVLPPLEKPSQNQIAELLFRTLGYVRTGVGLADSGRRVVNDQLRAWGVTPERDVAVRDGSGLSRHDYVSPNAIVRVLDGDPRRYGVPRVLRCAPDRRRRRHDPQPHEGHARRGERAREDRHGRQGAFALRLRHDSGRRACSMFSFLCNNYTVPTREVERVQDAIAARLASLGAATTTSSR